MARVLTPEDVLNATFTQTQFRAGYDEREVDDVLDAVVAAIRQAGASGTGPALTAEHVEQTRFTTTQLRRGYDPAEIDAFLVDVAHTLREHASGRTVAPGTGTRTAPSATPAAPTPPSASTAPAPGVPARESLGAKVVRFLRGESR